MNSSLKHMEDRGRTTREKCILEVALKLYKSMIKCARDTTMDLLETSDHVDSIEESQPNWIQ